MILLPVSEVFVHAGVVIVLFRKKISFFVRPQTSQMMMPVVSAATAAAAASSVRHTKKVNIHEAPEATHQYS